MNIIQVDPNTSFAIGGPSKERVLTERVANMEAAIDAISRALAKVQEYITWEELDKVGGENT